MRERAERIGGGAHLRVRNRAAMGTRVEMSVPGYIAFRSPQPHEGTQPGAVSFGRRIARWVALPLWLRVNTEKVVRKDSEQR
jgi:hypothetical protein